MDKTSSSIRLLALISIFFIYKAIMGAINSNSNEIILWSLITIIYLVSLVILYFVFKRWDTEKNL